MPLTDVLETIKDVDPADPEDNLVYAAIHVNQNERYTAHWDRNNNDVVDDMNEYSSIDHILISPELNEKVDSVVIQHLYNPLEVTDHFPVIVYLRD